MANYRKDVALIYFKAKPILLLDVHSLSSKEDYDTLKKEVEKNFNEFLQEMERSKQEFIKANEDFKKATDTKVSYLAKAVKENLEK